MTIVHIVLFEFQSTASVQSVQDTCDRFLAFKEKCVDPVTNKPYILEISGGKDNSPEGHQGGLTHGFVLKFASAADRDYYVAKDPVHLDFIKSLAGLLNGVRVLDYEPGVF